MVRFCLYCNKPINDGKKSYCSDECKKLATKERRKKYYEDNKELIAKRNKEWREKNREQYNKSMKERLLREDPQKAKDRYERYKQKMKNQKPKLLDNVLNTYLESLNDLPDI